MAKRAPTSRQPASDSKKQLIDAIVTVKNLQGFINEHGGAPKALEAVERVRKMVELTGGFDELKQALEIIGQEGSGASQE